MNVKKKKRYVRLVDRMILIALAVMVLSGILLHPLQGLLAIKILHKISSVFLVVGVIVHVAQHRKEGKARL